MNSNENADNPQRKGQEDLQFKKRITEILQRIEDRILNIVERSPSEDFTNDYIEQMSNTNYFKKAYALCHAFVKIPDIESLFIKYPDEFLKLEQDIQECQDLTTIHFLRENAKFTSDELASLPTNFN
ncbi:MAG TPA: hypothetical protein VFC67_22120 [Prolixibacteraceae bacterium]|nr:hypothetical protein [Prolixibacteraceae bacterium]